MARRPGEGWHEDLKAPYDSWPQWLAGWAVTLLLLPAMGYVLRLSAQNGFRGGPAPNCGPRYHVTNISWAESDSACEPDSTPPGYAPAPLPTPLEPGALVHPVKTHQLILGPDGRPLVDRD